MYFKLIDGVTYVNVAYSVKDAAPVSFQPLRDVLQVAIDHQDDKEVSPRDVAFAYYLTVLSLVVESVLKEDAASEYENRLKAFEYFRGKRDFYLTEIERNYFAPRAIVLGLKANDHIEHSRKSEMIKTIDSAWFTLVSG